MIASEFLTDSNKFVPMSNETNLRNSSLTHSEFDKGLLIWQTPYARRLYYNPQYNFSKDMNPYAQGLWAERAKTENKDKYRSICGMGFEKAKEDVKKGVK